MSFSIKLYTITAPEIKIDKAVTPEATYKCRTVLGNLLEDVQDVDAPYFEFDGSLLAPETANECDFFTCNYAYVTPFDKYYFITSRTIVDNDHVVLHMRCDVLKTFASQILGTTAWIARSASAGSWYLPDGLVPMSAQMTVQTPTNTDFFPFDLTPASDKPSYVVITAGGPVDSRLIQPDKYVKGNYLAVSSAVHYYSLSRDGVINLAAEICNGAIIDHWFDDFKSGIMRVMSFPFEISYETTDLVPLAVGNSQSITTSGYPLKSIFRTTDYRSKHNNKNLKITTPADFRINTGDYTIHLYLPFVGWQQLDPAIIRMKPWINIEYKTNLITGTGVCTVYAVTSETSPTVQSDVIGQFEYVAGIEIPITIDTSVEYTKNAISAALSTALSIGGAIVTKNPALIGGAVVSGATNMTRTLTQPIQIQMLGTSSFSNNANYEQNVTVIYRKRESPVLDGNDTQKNGFKNVHGNVCEKFLQVSQNTGFIKCSNWWMTPPPKATEAELSQIKSLMESGVIV
jgi:hypothetical protein